MTTWTQEQAEHEMVAMDMRLERETNLGVICLMEARMRQLRSVCRRESRLLSERA